MLLVMSKLVQSSGLSPVAASTRRGCISGFFGVRGVQPHLALGLDEGPLSCWRTRLAELVADLNLRSHYCREFLQLNPLPVVSVLLSGAQCGWWTGDALQRPTCTRPAHLCARGAIVGGEESCCIRGRAIAPPRRVGICTDLVSGCEAGFLAICGDDSQGTHRGLPLPVAPLRLRVHCLLKGTAPLPVPVSNLRPDAKRSQLQQIVLRLRPARGMYQRVPDDCGGVLASTGVRYPRRFVRPFSRATLGGLGAGAHGSHHVHGGRSR